MENKNFYSLFWESWIQTFDDAKLGRKELVSLKPLKETSYREMQALNEKGAGIFIQPNVGNGRKSENLKSIEWVYVDMDEWTKAEMMSIIGKSPITPDIIVESKRWYHLYWKVHCTEDQFKIIIDWLMTFFWWDTAIGSPNEVLRAPGFFHCKDPNDRFMIKVQHIDLQPHTPQDFIKVFPSTAQTFVKKFSTENADDVIRVIKNINITEVLRHCGVDVRNGSIFENWKQTSASIWKEWNIVKRFSGKEWGGSTIDIVMHYLWKNVWEAISYLKEYAGIVDETILEKITKEKKTDDIFAYSEPYTFGTRSLDKMMTPIQRNHFNLFVWETGHGKTAFCFYMAQENAKLGHKVLFLSLEMTTEAMYIRQAREFCWITKEQWRDKSKISESQKKAFLDHMEKLKNIPNMTLAWFPKEILPTPENISSVILEWKYDLVFIDNFDLIQSSEKDKLIKEEEMAKFFMDFTNSNNIPIFMLHHFKKWNDGKGSRWNDSIKWSSKITHSADNIFVGKRDTDPESINKTEFVITQTKDRDFWFWWFSIIHYNNGKFQDHPTHIWFQ